MSSGESARGNRVRGPVRVRAVVTLGCAGLAASAILSGCARFEPSAAASVDSVRPVIVGANADSTEQKVLGQLYAQTLSVHEGRPASVKLLSGKDSGEALDAIRSGEVDLIVTCTGSVLSANNPDLAREIHEEFEGAAGDKDPNDVDYNVATFEAMMSVLPPDLHATDQSGAEACAKAGGEDLPQSIIPVFRKTLFDRDELNTLDSLTKYLTTPEVKKLISDAEDSGSIDSTVSDFLAGAANFGSLTNEAENRSTPAGVPGSKTAEN